MNDITLKIERNSEGMVDFNMSGYSGEIADVISNIMLDSPDLLEVMELTLTMFKIKTEELDDDTEN